MDIFKWLKLRKYHYDIFLKPLPPLSRIKVIVHKVKGMIFSCAKPSTIEIGLTYRCQLNCRHCGVYGQSKTNQSELSSDEIKQIISQAHSLGVYLVVFSGGEPLMREDIAELVEFAVQKGVITALSTNGQLLSKEVAHKLKNKGIAFINISIDSADSVVHDRYRGLTGCFDKAREAIRICVNEGIAVIISTYASEENIHNGDLENIIKFARLSGARGVRILLSVPAGKWLGCSQTMLSEQDKRYIHNLLDPLYVYVEGIRNKFTECNAVTKKLFYISPYGEVQPCAFVPIHFGNIREEPLYYIWKRLKSHTFLGAFDGSDCIMRTPHFLRQYGGMLEKDDAQLPVKI